MHLVANKFFRSVASIIYFNNIFFSIPISGFSTMKFIKVSWTLAPDLIFLIILGEEGADSDILNGVLKTCGFCNLWGLFDMSSETGWEVVYLVDLFLYNAV